MNKAKILLLIVIGVMAIGYNPRAVFADEVGPDAAECAISVTVDSIIEWEDEDFPAIDLDSQESSISAQATSPEGSAVYTLWTNCNVELSADNTATAQLTDGTDVLVTKYKISTDGDGVTETGANAAAIAASGSDAYVLHNLFLATPLDIAHFNTDGAVEVTLEIEATNPSDEVADSGDYTATQTITATWTSDN
ncbi:MAG: hypothetical protein PHQ00_00505 [Phycisphaerae bacterium]|nr:hypothetical protein [Phycisphaerae bacterium]